MAGHSEDKGSGNGLFLHRHETYKENELLASAAQALEAWDIGVADIKLVSHSENIVFPSRF